MTWVAVAVGGAALVGGAASYLGSQKQASAAKHAADVTAAQQQTNAATQQPYVQSGYGAMARLNTLLGINPDPNISAQLAAQQNPSQSSQTTPPSRMSANGPLPMLQLADKNDTRRTIQPIQIVQNPQLRQLLSIRAQNGDAQAAQLLGMNQTGMDDNGTSLHAVS